MPNIPDVHVLFDVVAIENAYYGYDDDFISVLTAKELNDVITLLQQNMSSYIVAKYLDSHEDVITTVKQVFDKLVDYNLVVKDIDGTLSIAGYKDDQSILIELFSIDENIDTIKEKIKTPFYTIDDMRIVKPYIYKNHCSK